MPTSEPLVALPIRSFRDAFRRLAEALQPDLRADLARALAKHTAQTVVGAGAIPHIVTASDSVREWARGSRYPVIAEPSGQGLNGAARAAVRQAAGRPWLIIHADLPCLTSDEVKSLLNLLIIKEKVVAPSYDGGTSALGGRDAFRFRYGKGSFHRHLATRPVPAILATPGFLLDIDQPRDLRAAIGHPKGLWLAEALQATLFY
ncbi:MAG: 2-phospho-L-lactate guanylyltransferase [bacterium]|nr:2-phospho-L-lactate guanylyltransferase [bacterium]